MTKLRDEKGRYVKTPWQRWGQYVYLALGAMFVVSVVHLLVHLAFVPPMVVTAPPPPPRVITVPGEPIDWEKVAALQDARDRALLKGVGKEFQRLLDRNEQIAQPQFSQH